MDGSDMDCLLCATLLCISAAVFLTYHPLLCPCNALCTVIWWGYWKTVLQLFSFVPARGPETISVTECLGLFQNTPFFQGIKVLGCW